MRRVPILLALFLPACTSAPAPAPAPAPIVITKVVQVPVEGPRPTTILATAPRVVAVLQDSAAGIDKATRYVGWHGSKGANIDALGTLTAVVVRTTRALRASHRHGRYGLTQVRAARAATDALSAFLEHKGD